MTASLALQYAALSLPDNRCYSLDVPHVVSSGYTAEDLLARFEREDRQIDLDAVQVLRGPYFVPTIGVEYSPVYIDGDQAATEDRARFTRNLLRIANHNAEAKPASLEFAANLHIFHMWRVQRRLEIDSLVVMSDLDVVLGWDKFGVLTAYPNGPEKLWTKRTGFVYMVGKPDPDAIQLALV